MRIVIATGDTDLRLAIQLMLSEVGGVEVLGRLQFAAGAVILGLVALGVLILETWLAGRNQQATVERAGENL